MVLVLSEEFLYITMDDGNKIYAPDTGAVHNIAAFSVSNRRALNSENITTGQSSAPIGFVHGRALDTLTITFQIKDIKSYLNGISSECRVANTPKNMFMVSSILTVDPSSSGYEDLPVNSRWFVEVFSIKRNVSKRLYTCSLTLRRWYRDLPSQ